MSPKILEFAQQARHSLKEGFRKVAEPVSATLGPKGRNIILAADWGEPTPTKDGVTVAKEIILKDPGENVGAQLIKQVSKKANNEAGDGPQPLYSLVLTPNGFTEMGLLKVGDAICGTNGSIQNVIGVYPKGQKEIFKITLFDGKEIECSEDHTWSVTTYYGKNVNLTTRALIDNKVVELSPDGSKKHKYFIPTSAAQFNTSNLPLDPYLVGLLLGDGSLSGTGGVELSLGPNDAYILDDIILPDGITFTAKYNDVKHYFRVKIQGHTSTGKYIKDYLDELNLLGTKSDTKFIPKNYLYSDLESRVKLLQGLTDTDGHTNKRGLLEYNTVSLQLAKDVVELMRGLGKTVRLSMYERTGNSFSNTPIYRVSEMKGDQYGVSIDKIEATGKYVEMQCIKVSNEDHLYFTNDYALTHNTTTATVLAYAMVDLGDKYLDKKVNVTSLKTGIDKGVQKVFELLSEQTQLVEVTDLEKLESIATISGNDANVGKLVSEAYTKIDSDGTVALHRNEMPFDEIEVKEGFKFDRGYISPYFVTNPDTMKVEYDNPLILIWEKRIEHAQDTLNFLQSVLVMKRPLVIITDDVVGDALSTFIVNKMKQIIPIVCVKAPEYGDMRKSVLQDIAVYTGATYFGEELGSKLDRVPTKALGTCDKVVISAGETTIINGGGDKKAIEDHVEMISTLLKDKEYAHDYDKLRSRLARLNGKAVYIKIGARTESELQEKKYRYDDAISATKAAIESGVVTGGGKALINCWIRMQDYKLENIDENIGLDILKEALLVPAKTIALNAGINGDTVVDKLKDLPLTVGYNAKTSVYEDLMESGVVDPVKVTKTALESAASIAGIYFTTEGLIYTAPRDDK